MESPRVGAWLSCSVACSVLGVLEDTTIHMAAINAARSWVRGEIESEEGREPLLAERSLISALAKVCIARESAVSAASSTVWIILDAASNRLIASNSAGDVAGYAAKSYACRRRFSDGDASSYDEPRRMWLVKQREMLARSAREALDEAAIGYELEQRRSLQSEL